MDYKGLLQGNEGKKVFIKRKSTPQYTVVGVIVDFDEEKVFISSEKDSYLIDYTDISSLDIKSSSQYARYS